jgi:succinate dehydrogenase / fumarate reductase cytochrome b subunit
MGITGLLLCGFLLTHLAGNLLIFVGPEAFNKYSHALISNKAIYIAEAILAAIFLSHIGLAIKLTMENKAARPEGYYMRKHSGRGSTFASSTMPYTGMIGFVFLVLHILGIKFGAYYEATYDGVVIRDVYRTTIELFQNPANIAFYVLAVVALGIHVSHGFWSAFQSLGFNHPKYMPKIKLVSKLFGLLVAVGFGALPIVCYFLGAK